jgi:hypothetical protein
MREKPGLADRPHPAASGGHLLPREKEENCVYRSSAQNRWIRRQASSSFSSLVA